MQTRQNAGIATLHYGFNEGAILQANSLASIVCEMWPSFHAEIIDQRYPTKSKIYGAPDTPRKRALQDAINCWLPLSSRRFSSDDISPVIDYINDRYDVLFVGSDVVWTLEYKGRLRRFIPGGIFPYQPNQFYPAFPNLYWPDKEVEIPKASFAASVGKLEWMQIPSSDKARMQRILDGFVALGVRDERTARFIEWIDPGLSDRIKLLPDPTLAADLRDPHRREKLQERLVSLEVDFTRPICGIVSSNDPKVAEVADRLRKKGYQILGITTRNQFSDVELFDVDFHPLDWTELFGMLDMCITERMHAAIFCIKHHTPLIALDINETRHDNDSKTRSLLRRFGIEDYVVSKKNARLEDLVSKVDQLERQSVDWRAVDRELLHCREQVEEYFDLLKTLVFGKSLPTS